ncbi:MAG: hypothetical protein COV99_06940 [Bacteroidetes bacterium CG12_big_fil_rev_8_21_14_0_65_60_17]|nr:MAG: hypothetical protein COV99_06940 [Bacteroidetes bacterium CG12_big_fil_rev_8_21_14_0_65_60_17]
MNQDTYDTVVVGAGPVGLACAIELKRIGHRVVVMDKGALVNSLIGYPTNMEFFSTPELLEIGGYPFATRNYKPRREEALDYYRRVAFREDLPLALHETVVDLRGSQPAFTLVTDKRTVACSQVVLAIGFFDIPNRLDVPGGGMDKVVHYYKEPYAYTGRDVLIVGAKNSAAKAALDCLRNGARVSMVVRGDDIGESVKYWIRPDLKNRIAEGAITATFNSGVERIEEKSVTIRTPDGLRTIANDVVLAMTGYRPDFALLERLGVTFHADAARTPIYNDQTMETERPGLFVAGTVCGGLRTSRWFIENGRFHAEAIANSLSA